MSHNELDHIVIAGPNLEDLVDWFADATGIRAAQGGRHNIGTANALVGLSSDGEVVPRYIELIAPDPEAPTNRPTPTAFGINHLGAPRIVGYAIRTPSIESAVARVQREGFAIGDIERGVRTLPDGRVLSWDVTRGYSSSRPELPFLIDWRDSPHPGRGEIPRLDLVAFERAVRDRRSAENDLELLGLGSPDVALVQGDSDGFVLRVKTASGDVVELGR
ncbi:MAG: VOC family protein [Mycetocola sp.]